MSKRTESEARLVKSAVSATSLLVLLIFVLVIGFSFAWFSSNIRTAATGMAVQVACGGTDFDVGSIGENAGYYRDKMDALGVASAGSPASIAGENGTSTASASSVYWNMTDESNLFNQDDSLTHKIGPGTTGKITFCILPKKEGELHVTLYLSLLGYRDDPEDPDGAPIPNGEEQAEDFLNGHICFFTERTGDAAPYSFAGYLSDGVYEETFRDVHAGDAIPVTLYWYWPGVLEDMLSADADRDLAKRITAEPEHFFKAPNASVLASLTTAEKIASVTLPQNRADYSTLSSYYNQADQAIGTNCGYLLLKLSTENGNAQGGEEP